MLVSRVLLLILPAALLGSCETTTETDPAGLHLAVVKATHPVRAWEVREGGRVVGTVVQYDEAEDPEAPAGRFYSVRNPWQQELGTVDAMGRAWRFVPHEREARWVSTGTLAEGAGAILDASVPIELVEVPIEALAPAE